MPTLSDNLYRTNFSPLRNYGALIEKAKEYATVYELHLGNPDLPKTLDKTPLIMGITNTNDITQEALGKLKDVENYAKKLGLSFGNVSLPYGPSEGVEQLREIIANGYRKFGIKKDNVYITTAGSEALDILLRAFLDQRKDTVVIPEPFYTNDNQIATFSGFRILPIPRKFEDGFKMPQKGTIEEIIERHTGTSYSRINAFIITAPDNPSGYTLTKDELGMFGEFVTKHDSWLIIDSAYNNITNGNYTNPFEISGLENHLVEVISFSKTYNIPGARVGAIISKNKELCEQILKPLQARLCVAMPSQKIAEVVYNITSERDLIEASKTYRRRVEVVCKELDKLENLEVSYIKPEGSFYIPVRVAGEDTEKLLIYTLSPKFYRETKAVTTFAPMRKFHATEGEGVNDLRLALVEPKEELINAIPSLGEGIKRYKEHGGALK